MLDWRRVGSWCGIAGPAIFTIGYIAAVLTTPGYRIGGQWVSDLGVSPGAVYFNGGVIIAGLLAIPFAFGLLSSLRPQKIGYAASAVMILAAASLIGVGIFTEDAGPLHWMVSVSFFSLLFLALLLFSISFHLSSLYRPTFSVFTGLMVVTGLIVGMIDGAGPFSEVVTVFIAVIWSITVASRLKGVSESGP